MSYLNQYLTDRIFETELFRYLLAGTFAFCIDFSTLYFLTDFFGLHYVAANSIAFSLGLIAIYLLSIHWVFDNRKIKKQHNEFMLFLGVGVVGLLISDLSLVLFTETVGLFYLMSKIVSAGIVLVWNFTARKIIIF